MYYGKTGDEFAGFGIIGGGIMLCYFLEPIFKMFDIVERKYVRIMFKIKRRIL